MHGGGCFDLYENILAAEGLAPVDDGAGKKWIDGNWHDAPRSGEAEAVEAWRAWADGITATFRFRSEQQRTVWTLYAEGVPVRDIPARAGGDFRETKRMIARIKAKSPWGPRNPWLRTPTETPTERPSMRTLHYKKLALYKSIPTPGKPSGLDVFNEVDGIPHAGGVDIMWEGYVLLATWGNLKYATREMLKEAA